MLNENDVINSGFKPLKKQATEPVTLASSKPTLQRGVSFNMGGSSSDTNSSGSSSSSNGGGGGAGVEGVLYISILLI